MSMQRKIEVESALEQAEGKLSKGGLQDFQDSLMTKDEEWLMEFREQLSLIVQSWTLSRQPNLNYFYVVHNYVTNARDQAHHWEPVVDQMLTVLAELRGGNASDVGKIMRVLTVWAKEKLFGGKGASWRKTFGRLQAMAGNAPEPKSEGVAAAVPESSGPARKRPRSPAPPPIVSPAGGGEALPEEYREAIRAQTVTFLCRVFSCLHDQYGESLRESGREHPDNHSSLNMVMFGAFHLLHLYQNQYERAKAQYDSVALGIACIFLAGKSEYFFIKCERLRSVSQKFVQQCFGSSTLVPQNHQVFEYESYLLDMLGYDTSELAESACGRLLHLLSMGPRSPVEEKVCRRAIQLLSSDTYLQSLDCIHHSGEVLCFAYLLLADQVGETHSRRLKVYTASVPVSILNGALSLLTDMHARPVYAESSFRDCIKDASRRIKKVLSILDSATAAAKGSVAVSPALSADSPAVPKVDSSPALPGSTPVLGDMSPPQPVRKRLDGVAFGGGRDAPSEQRQRDQRGTQGNRKPIPRSLMMDSYPANDHGHPRDFNNSSNNRNGDHDGSYYGPSCGFVDGSRGFNNRSFSDEGRNFNNNSFNGGDSGFGQWRGDNGYGRYGPNSGYCGVSSFSMGYGQSSGDQYRSNGGYQHEWQASFQGGNGNNGRDDYRRDCFDDRPNNYGPSNNHFNSNSSRGSFSDWQYEDHRGRGRSPQRNNNSNRGDSRERRFDDNFDDHRNGPSMRQNQQRRGDSRERDSNRNNRGKPSGDRGSGGEGPQEGSTKRQRTNPSPVSRAESASSSISVKGALGDDDVSEVPDVPQAVDTPTTRPASVGTKMRVDSNGKQPSGRVVTVDEGSKAGTSEPVKLSDQKQTGGGSGVKRKAGQRQEAMNAPLSAERQSKGGKVAPLPRKTETSLGVAVQEPSSSFTTPAMAATTAERSLEMVTAEVSAQVCAVDDPKPAVLRAAGVSAPVVRSVSESMGVRESCPQPTKEQHTVGPAVALAPSVPWPEKSVRVVTNEDTASKVGRPRALETTRSPRAVKSEAVVAVPPPTELLIHTSSDKGVKTPGVDSCSPRSKTSSTVTPRLKGLFGAALSGIVEQRNVKQ